MRTAFLGLSISVIVSGHEKRQQRPNIVFLMSDSMDGRMVDKSSTESEAVEMPFLRGTLAKNGANFVKMYSNNPMCVPSRTSMMTGRRSDQINVWGNSQGLAASPEGVLDDTCVKRYGEKRCQKLAAEQGMPEHILSVFQKLGYRVHQQGRSHIGAGLLNSKQHNSSVDGHLTMEAFDGLRTGEVIRSADIRHPMEAPSIFLSRAIDDAKADTFFGGADWAGMAACSRFVEYLPSPSQLEQPFFLHCSLNLPHFAFSTNSTWLAKVNDDKVRIPNWLPGFPENYHPYDPFMTTAKAVNEEYGKEDIIKLRKIYYAMCAEADQMLSGIWDTLVNKGYTLDNTYIIYVSDHGEMKFEHRQMYKASLYEGSGRVPLTIAGPGITKGKHVDTHVTSLLDVFPTLLDMAQVSDEKAYAKLEGRSVLAAAGGKSVAPEDKTLKSQWDDRDFVLSQYNWVEANTGLFMVRSGAWKAFFYGHTYDAFKNYKPQLFNLDEDPEELKNVADEYEHVVKRLEERLREVLDPDEVDRSVCAEDFQHLLDLSCGGGNTCTELSDQMISYAPNDSVDIFKSWFSQAQNLFQGQKTPVMKHLRGVEQ